MTKLVRFPNQAAMRAASSAEASRRGCGRNPQDVTRYWYRHLGNALYLDDTEPTPAGGTVLTGTARTDYEAANTPRTS